MAFFIHLSLYHIFRLCDIYCSIHIRILCLVVTSTFRISANKSITFYSISSLTTDMTSLAGICWIYILYRNTCHCSLVLYVFLKFEIRPATEKAFMIILDFSLLIFPKSFQTFHLDGLNLPTRCQINYFSAYTVILSLYPVSFCSSKNFSRFGLVLSPMPTLRKLGTLLILEIFYEKHHVASERPHHYLCDFFLVHH